MTALIERISIMTDTDLQFTVPSPWVNDTRILTIEQMIRKDVLKHGDEHLVELKTFFSPTQTDFTTSSFHL